ncbi:MAG: BatD family protein [Pseudomonadota bacterium]
MVAIPDRLGADLRARTERRRWALPSLTAWGVLVLSMIACTAQARVDVAVDPPILSLGESLTVTFSADERGLTEPDFSPLEAQFDVLRKNSRETLQIINGQAQQTKVWRLTLVPREEGTLEIPSIEFGANRSPSRRITVTPARSERPGEAEVFIEVSVDPQGPVYVQSQVMMTVRLHWDEAVRLSNATLAKPSSRDGDLVVETVAEERSEKRIGERDYRVFEQRYALFPQRSGQVELDPIVFSADMRLYYERPSFRRVQSDSVVLDVLPANPGGARPWLPASAITLEQSFPDAGEDGELVGRVGEPVTRSVTLNALGLTSAQLPEVQIPVPVGFKVYPDQPTFDQRVALEGILGERVERLAMLPTVAGVFELPAVELEWWDVAADLPRTARLDPVRIRVLPAVGDGSNGDSVGSANGVIAGADGALGTVPPAGGSSAVGVRYEPGLWPWLALFMAFGWAATGGFWWQSRRAGEGAAGATEQDLRSSTDESIAASLKRLRDAVQAGEPGEVRIATLRWARARWPKHGVRDLIDVRRLGGETLEAALDAMDAARYGDGADTDGALQRVLEQAELLSEQMPREVAGTGQLEPLYR